MTASRRIDCCRSCGSEQLDSAFELEPTPLIGTLGSRNVKEEVYDLSLLLCQDCGLIQLSEIPPFNEIFKNYISVSEEITATRVSKNNYLEKVSKICDLKPDALIVEIGSGDGGLLSEFSNMGYRTLGIESSHQYCTLADAKGIDTINGMFNKDIATQIEEVHGLVDVFIVDNSSGRQHPAHICNISDPEGYVENIASILSGDGLVVVRVPDLRKFVSSIIVDYFYHEHQSYFSLDSLENLFSRFGLHVVRAEVPGKDEYNATYYFCKRRATDAEYKKIEEIVEVEKVLQLREISAYKSFKREIDLERARFHEQLDQLQDKSIVGYGASTASTNLIYQLGISKYLKYLVDDNEIKIGTFPPGLDLQVKKVNSIYDEGADIIVVLAWAYAQRIENRHVEFPGHFMVPYTPADGTKGESVYYIRETCRLCESRDLVVVLRLTPTALCDAFLTSKRSQSEYPLNLCLCQSCGFVQLDSVVEPREIYKEYLFVTTSSAPLLKHFSDYADTIVNKLYRPKESLVVDIGSNEGTLLQYLSAKGCRTLGVEPATKIAELANARGINTVAEYFDCSVAKQIVKNYGSADVITVNNLFANIDDLAAFTKELNTLVKADGLVIIESSYLGDMISNTMFDFIYHEHLSYLSVKPLKKFFESNGFVLEEIQSVDTKGGSLRYFFRKTNSVTDIGPTVAQWLIHEEDSNLDSISTFRRFSLDIDQERRKLVELLGEYEAGSIIGYGASATSTTLIYHFGISSKLKFLVDDNPAKIGTYSPGYNFPVYSSARILEPGVEVVLILAWRYASEIMAKHPEFNGRFIVPLPSVEKF